VPRVGRLVALRAPAVPVLPRLLRVLLLQAQPNDLQSPAALLVLGLLVPHSRLAQTAPQQSLQPGTQPRLHVHQLLSRRVRCVVQLLPQLPLSPVPLFARLHLLLLLFLPLSLLQSLIPA
jgi:hypothetical protein